MKSIGKTNKSPVAIILPNYNMPEATDAICKYIKKNVGHPNELIVVDNGSDIRPPSKYTTIRVNENLQTTAGWLLGLSFADHLEIKRNIKFFAYWILITSTSFPTKQGDILSPLVHFLKKNSNAVGIAHSLTKDSTTNWQHLYDQGGGKPRKTWMLDNISTLYRAEWFNLIGRFDPNMCFAWGSDLETSHLARKDDKSLWIYEGIKVKKESDIGYKMGRMNMSARARRQLATENMESVLSKKYGKNWQKIILDQTI